MSDSYRKGMLYPNNILEGFASGALLDLRVRMAIGFINQSPIFHEAYLAALNDGECSVENLPKVAASIALDLAEEITSQAAERGWLEPLTGPEDTEIGEALRAQAKRTAAYQVLQQLGGQKFAQEEQGKVVPAAPGVMDPRKH